MSQETPPWLSIITVCYNDSNNLSRTIQSIRNQQCDFIQSIVIDGGSIDNTLSIIHENSDVISDWISEKDRGLYDAMNKGIALVKGKYILFLNAGDLFHDPQVVSFAKSNGNDADVIYGDAIIVNQDGSYKSQSHKKTPPRLTWKSFKYGMVVCHQSMFIKSIIAMKYDIKFKISADIDWAIRTVKNAKTTKYLGITICDFQTGGLSSQYKRLALMERWTILSTHFGVVTSLISHGKIIYKFIFKK